MPEKGQDQNKQCCSRFTFIAVAFLIRMVLVYVAKLVDENTSNMRYTDTDYDVFSDAATHVFNGDSPYKRHTYRYTPLAAYICLVNNYMHPLMGKVVFCLIDCAMGLLLWSLIESQNKSKRNTIWYVAFWVYNPTVIVISTRGSNDNIITMLVYAVMYFVLKRQYIIGGLFYGLAVHFKIYPIVYCIPLYLYIDSDKKAIIDGRKGHWQIIFSNFFTKNRIVFGLVSACTFFALTGLFYKIYGWEFLYEGYLYHLIRKDNRHNVSVYWNMIYQMYDAPSSQTVALLMFVPQWSIILFAGFAFYYDIFLAIIIQTWAFVAFNKVMTAQYFLWYLSLAPIIAINNGVVHQRPILGVVLYLTQALAMPLWSGIGFYLEFMGENKFQDIHYFNLAFFAVNIVSMALVLRYHKLTVTFEIADD